MSKFMLSALILISGLSLSAQQALNNNAIIGLVKAGLSDDVIITTINASAGTYDTSADGLIALKQANVSDKIISAIVIKGTAQAPALQSSTPVPATTTSATTTDPDNPDAPHEAGIYIFKADAPAGSKMIMLEPNVYTQGKTGGILASAMTYGIAKAKMKAVLRGDHANTQFSESLPVFYFYFEITSAGLSQASGIFGGTTTPNEYSLLKFDIKGNSRETIIGKIGAFGASGGTDENAIINFTYTKLRPGVYKVWLTKPLENGEYGFISSGGSVAVGPMGGATNSRVFDFGKR